LAHLPAIRAQAQLHAQNPVQILASFHLGILGTAFSSINYFWHHLFTNNRKDGFNTLVTHVRQIVNYQRNVSPLFASVSKYPRKKALNRPPNISTSSPRIRAMTVAWRNNLPT
jgi:hypothetical protein